MVVWLAIRFSCEEASFPMASSRLSKVDLERVKSVTPSTPYIYVLII